VDQMKWSLGALLCPALSIEGDCGHTSLLRILSPGGIGKQSLYLSLGIPKPLSDPPNRQPDRRSQRLRAVMYSTVQTTLS
jgi:hypothetical protein